MTEETTSQTRDPETSRGSEIAAKLDAAGWGLFFIWIGVAFLVDVGLGVGLVGVGVITLGGQVARRYFELGFEAFWLVVGVVFVLGGGWELLEPDVALLPLLSIFAGAVLLLSAIGGKRWIKRRHS